MKVTQTPLKRGSFNKNPFRKEAPLKRCVLQGTYVHHLTQLERRF